MSKRPRRKVVLVLVEGNSDQNALEYGLGALYDEVDESVELAFLQKEENGKRGGDITSDNGIKPDNIERMINKLFIDPFLKDYGLYPKDIDRIIQIVDTDGAYIPDEHIYAKAVERTEYLDDGIYAADPERIVERNKRKRFNIDALCEIESIKVGSKSIPYQVYFFSCNLDHYISGERNLNAWYKTSEAGVFAKKCRENNKAFQQRFLPSAEANCFESWEESWDFIKTGMNSLKCHSNLCFFIESIVNG